MVYLWPLSLWKAILDSQACKDSGPTSSDWVKWAALEPAFHVAIMSRKWGQLEAVLQPGTVCGEDTVVGAAALLGAFHRPGVILWLAMLKKYEFPGGKGSGLGAGHDGSSRHTDRAGPLGFMQNRMVPRGRLESPC